MQITTKCEIFYLLMETEVFLLLFNCSEEGRPPSVTEKSQSASSSPQGPRRNWASPSHSIHGSEPHRKHSELFRRTSTASGTKTQDCIYLYNCTQLSFFSCPQFFVQHFSPQTKAFFCIPQSILLLELERPVLSVVSLIDDQSRQRASLRVYH